jgi:hypothetical protein
MQNDTQRTIRVSDPPAVAIAPPSPWRWVGPVMLIVSVTLNFVLLAAWVVERQRANIVWMSRRL